MDNQKLAQLIYSVATYDGYNTSVLQTEKNIATKKSEWEFQSESDRYIFEDLMKAIKYASTMSELIAETLKNINAQMNSKEKGQPEQPGVLRKNTPVTVGDYQPSDTITEDMVQRRLESISDNSIESGWELYARLSKLQAFDDGNKRTSLIAANYIVGAFKEGADNYLIIPTNYKRARFDANLVDYYMADNWDNYLPDEKQALQNFVNFASHCTYLDQNNMPDEKNVKTSIRPK